MSTKSRTILTVTAALAALSGVSVPVAANATAPAGSEAPIATEQSQRPAQSGQPNVLLTAGQDLLGLVVAKHADGGIVAQHYSHASHASHASHYSHYSSR
jgi:hypothetical protein